MSTANRTERLERHALVMAIWIPAGLVAATAMHYGLNAGGAAWILAAFGAVILGFIGHVIVNAVLGTEFLPREVALGLVFYVCAVLALVLGVLTVDGFADRSFLPVAGGLAALAAVAIFYMLTHYGVRRAFENFDVIREFNPRTSSRLQHRRGRR